MTRQTIRRAILTFALVIVAAVSARGGELSDDLKARRARVMDALGADAMLIVWSAPRQRYSLDIDYEYRQDSNLYYLTGIAQDDTIVVLMPGNEARREILFVKDKSPAREHWTGPLLTHEEAASRSGIGRQTWISRSRPDGWAHSDSAFNASARAASGTSLRAEKQTKEAASAVR